VLTQEAASPCCEAGRHLPELLFVHGAWHGAWCWTRIQAVCALAGFRSHAVNLRGHGQSSGHEYLARIHLDEYVADVIHVARDLSAPFFLLGHSLGGLIAQRYLALLQQGHDVPRPAGVVLLATALPADMAHALRSPTVTRHFGGRLGTVQTLLKMQVTGDATAFVSSPELVRALFFTPNTPDQDVIDCFIRLQNESVSVLREVQRLASAWPTPHRGATPILVLGGAQDACFPPAALKRLAAAYGATLHLFGGIGHDLMLDHRWEQVADAILDWVRGLPAADERPATHVASRHSGQVIPLRPLLVPLAPRPERLADDADQATGIQIDASNGRHRRGQFHAG
jgi:pimeloyl-ACP methyl ester carboxylesterase